MKFFNVLNGELCQGRDVTLFAFNADVEEGFLNIVIIKRKTAASTIPAAVHL